MNGRLVNSVKNWSQIRWWFWFPFSNLDDTYLSGMNKLRRLSRIIVLTCSRCRALIPHVLFSNLPSEILLGFESLTGSILIQCNPPGILLDFKSFRGSIFIKWNPSDILQIFWVLNSSQVWVALLGYNSFRKTFS